MMSSGFTMTASTDPSMKVPPKRKGNASSKQPFEWETNPQ